MGKKMASDEVGELLHKPRAVALLLEVSSDWIKLLEITSDRSGVKIAKAYLEPVDVETVIAESLLAACKTCKFSDVPLICAIPRQLVNVRLLELPSVEWAEIQDMVELQVGRQTPYSLQEILSDFKLIGHTRQGTYTRVLLAIVQRSVVRERYYAVEDAGLKVERMGISSEGVMRWLLYHTRKASPEKIILLLDVDSYFTHMLVTRHHKVIFTKSLLWGSKHADTGTEGFVDRVQEAIRSCEDALQGQHFDEVLLSGARAARSPEMVQAIASVLQVPCRSVDVLDDVAVHAAAQPALSEDVIDAVSLTGLIGMALAPDALMLHFVPDVYAMRQRLFEMGKNWAGVISGLAALLVAGSLYFTMAMSTRGQLLRDLEIAAAVLRPQAAQVDRRVEVIRATRSRQEARLMPEFLLPAIHASLPEGVYIDALVLQIENGRFSINGSAPQRRDIREFIRLLEEKGYFSGVEEGGGTAMDNSQRFRFQINGLIRGEGQS
ncbi:MAG: pilus assembly protein PilM [Kiritimatiellia bacterium]